MYFIGKTNVAVNSSSFVILRLCCFKVIDGFVSYCDLKNIFLERQLSKNCTLIRFTIERLFYVLENFRDLSNLYCNIIQSILSVSRLNFLNFNNF